MQPFAPKISIIIPAYNAAAFLAETIGSVIRQTWKNKELIIIDDASIDETYLIAKAHECEWIQVFKLEQNKGQSYCSNLGLGKSSGEVIKFLDADDLISDSYLAEMMDNYQDDSSMYFSHCINFEEKAGQKTFYSYDIEDWSSMLPIAFLLGKMSNMRQGGRWLIPRKIIEIGGGWNEELSLINDYEYFNRLCLHSSKIWYCKTAILYYRRVSGSLSSQTTENAYLSAYKSITLSGELLLSYENSKMTNVHIANAYQGLLYSIYPKYPKITSLIESKIKSLGGATLDPYFGGKIINVVAKILGWKFAKHVQMCKQAFYPK